MFIRIKKDNDNIVLSSKDFKNNEEFSKIFWELYKPFYSLRKILLDITKLSYPSGIAFISEAHTINKLYLSEREETPIHYFDERFNDRFLYLNNYAGPEGGMYSWKGLTQLDIENTFNIKFNNQLIQKIIGKFPSSITLGLPA